MGLDGVELMMDVEDHFGITLRPSEATTVRTVGDFVSLIHQRVTAAEKSTCVTLKTFYSLRTTVREFAGDPDLRIRPSDLVVDKLTVKQRQDFWRQLSQNFEHMEPSFWLQTPRHILKQLFWALLLLVTNFLIFGYLIDSVTSGIFAIVVLAIVMAFLIDQWRQKPPKGWKTFGEITQKIVGLTAATKQQHLRTENDVFLELRPLIVEVLGCKAELVTPDARFVEDLAMD